MVDAAVVEQRHAECGSSIGSSKKELNACSLRVRDVSPRLPHLGVLKLVKTIGCNSIEDGVFTFNDGQRDAVVALQWWQAAAVAAPASCA